MTNKKKTCDICKIGPHCEDIIKHSPCLLYDSARPFILAKNLANEIIDAERDRQNDKWGFQDHPSEWWLAILMEEVGELSKEMLEKQFGPQGHSFKPGVRLIQELIQVAAVSRAWLESLLVNDPSPSLIEILKNHEEVK